MNLKKLVITFLFPIFMVNVSLIAQEKKSALPASISDLAGLWEVSKIEQPYGSSDTSSVQQWIGKKYRFRRVKFKCWMNLNSTEN